MIIESEYLEPVLEYFLSQEANLDKSVLQALTDPKSYLNENNQTEDLFGDILNNEAKIVIYNVDLENQETNSPNDLIWILKLDLKLKTKFKKEGTKVISLSKINRSLLKRLESELNFISRKKEFDSYYEVLEEYYKYSLNDKRYDPMDQKIEKVPLFFLSINNLSKFYQNYTEDEAQLILSLILTKSLKVNNLQLAKTVEKIDRTMKSGNTALSSKNAFGYNIYLYNKLPK